MLKKIDDLPAGVIGIEAHGTVTKEDYDSVMNPLLDEIYQHGKRVRFLYRVAPDFSTFTAGAVWDDFRIGRRYLRLFERCAVVGDVDWISRSAHLMAPLMPCPVRAFTGQEMQPALAWLSAPPRDSNLRVDLQADKGVVIVEPKGALSGEDFDRLAAIVDPWLEEHQMLHGVVIHIRKFPGWENFGSLLRHIQFVRGHHKNVERVAIAGGGLAVEILPRVASHFVKAEVKSFDYESLDRAVAWAAGAK